MSLEGLDGRCSSNGEWERVPEGGSIEGEGATAVVLGLKTRNLEKMFVLGSESTGGV